jgi:hypothetical protein
MGQYLTMVSKAGCNDFLPPLRLILRLAFNSSDQAPMSTSRPAQPYQPLLLRLLHGVTAIFLIAAIITAFWTYNTFDGRWGQLPLPKFTEIESIHGTFALFTLLVFPLFAVYALRQGRARLVQPNSLHHLKQTNQPIWGYTLNRIGNTLTLLALTFALFSGKMMDSNWLPRGELNHAWYYAHLISWLVMVASLSLHLLLNARQGGLSLLVSMFKGGWRGSESPRYWPQRLRAWWQTGRSQLWIRYWQAPPLFLGLEWGILISLIAAWLIPLFAYP